MGYENDIEKVLVSQEEIQGAVKRICREMENDFNLGFLSNLTDSEKYARMEEFARKLPPDYIPSFFGDVMFYSPKSTLGKNKLIKLERNLKGLLEKPEFRDIWNDAKYEADENDIARALGMFVRNKPGRKIK